MFTRIELINKRLRIWRGLTTRKGTSMSCYVIKECGKSGQAFYRTNYRNEWSEMEVMRTCVTTAATFGNVILATIVADMLPGEWVVMPRSLASWWQEEEVK